MSEPKHRSVDQYLAAQPEASRVVLERVRSTIQKALPGAEETISYQIPAYCLHGRVALYFAGWSRHFSLYPATERVVAACADELAGYVLSKGTIRFPLGEKVPVRLIARIAKLRAQEVAEGAQQTKSATAEKRRAGASTRTGKRAAAAGRAPARTAERAPARSGGRATAPRGGQAKSGSVERASAKPIPPGGKRSPARGALRR